MLPAAPTYQNIYALAVAFPLLDSITLVIIALLMLALGVLLIEQNDEIPLHRLVSIRL
jgi:uncharacterized protein (UPF0248 family)